MFEEEIIKITDLLKSLNSIELHKLKDYFRKFVPSEEPQKKECCLSFCTRLSKRYCHNCPHHPMRDDFERDVLEISLMLLSEKRYGDFIEHLFNSGYPYPVCDEVQLFLSKLAAESS